MISIYSGFSWKTNQYGLTVDTVEAYELVKPDGTVSTVTESSDSELFFGLKVCVYSNYDDNASMLTEWTQISYLLGWSQ